MKLRIKLNRLKILKKSPPEELVIKRVKFRREKVERSKSQKPVTGITILTSNKLLTRLSVLLAQINSYKKF